MRVHAHIRNKRRRCRSGPGTARGMCHTHMAGSMPRHTAAPLHTTTNNQQTHESPLTLPLDCSPAPCGAAFLPARPPARPAACVAREVATGRRPAAHPGPRDCPSRSPLPAPCPAPNIHFPPARPAAPTQQSSNSHPCLQRQVVVCHFGQPVPEGHLVTAGRGSGGGSGGGGSGGSSGGRGARCEQKGGVG